MLSLKNVNESRRDSREQEQMTSIHHKSTADFATAAIRQMILTGELLPGARVDQNTIATHLDISRHPVRQAIERLAERGFVISRPHHSVVVAELSVADMENLYQARTVVEEAAIRLAWPNYDSDFIALSEKHLVAMERADRLEDLDEYMIENFEFHMNFYRRSNNPHLIRVIASLFQLSERYQRTALMTEKRHSASTDEHRAMLESIADNDIESLMSACRNHNLGTMSTVQSLLEEN